MDKLLLRLKEQIDANHDQMIADLHRFCLINSGTENLPGLKIMAEELIQSFTGLADEIQSHDLPTTRAVNLQGQEINQHYGRLLYLRKRPELKRRVLLVGHMDTVYSIDHPFQTLQQLDDNTLNGPGVADMKGGLLVMLNALKAFELHPAAQTLGWDVIINPDEETGSLGSMPFINQKAPLAQAGLVYEPAMTAEGTLAKNRKGSGRLSLIARGRAAHAGRAFAEGRNAIAYLAEVLVAVHQLNQQREGVTLNIGKISGGEALNVVPDLAVAKLDIRISQPEDAQWVLAEMDKIKARFERPDYQLEIEGHFHRPVKTISQGTERLFQRIQKIGQTLGITIDWKDSGGCCDGNNLVQHGLAVIDTLGVRGGAIHSPQEFVLLDSLTERALLSAFLLVDLAQDGLEDLIA